MGQQPLCRSLGQAPGVRERAGPSRWAPGGAPAGRAPCGVSTSLVQTSGVGTFADLLRAPWLPVCVWQPRSFL